MSVHYTRDFVWVVHTSLGSINLGDSELNKLKGLGVNGIYLNAADPLATNAKRKELVNKGFKVGLFYPASTEFQFGRDVANALSTKLDSFAGADQGQTPVLCDFEPTYGSVDFWRDFLWIWRSLRPGRVTDYTPEPFKAADTDLAALITNGRMDVRVQYYFGDMSPVDGGEARDDYISRGVDPAAVRGFVDGGRVIKPPIFYQGRVVRRLQNGTIIWNSNLLREAGLI